MATTACFIIVSRNDIPIYEAELGSAIKVCSLIQFLIPICFHARKFNELLTVRINSVDKDLFF